MDSGTMKMYINGVKEASEVSATMTATDKKLRIGVNQEGDESNFYSGSMDEVIVENVAWSAEKVKKYYTYAKGRFGII
jgi:hypothetical protein